MTDNQVIDKLCVMEKKLDEVLLRVGDITDWRSRVDKTLWGNGAPGLCVRVQALLWLGAGLTGTCAVVLGHALARWLGG